jgi:hypothetical protein
MRRLFAVLSVGLLLSTQVSRAHQDAVIGLEDDGTLLGIPAEFGPGKLEVSFASPSNHDGWHPPVSSVVLTLGKHRVLLPKCATAFLNSQSLKDVYVSASWHHSQSLLPYYLNVVFFDPGYGVREETPGFRLLFNLRTAKLMRMQVMLLEHAGTVGRDLPLDLKEMCRDSDEIPEIG